MSVTPPPKWSMYRSVMGSDESEFEMLSSSQQEPPPLLSKKKTLRRHQQQQEQQQQQQKKRKQRSVEEESAKTSTPAVNPSAPALMMAEQREDVGSWKRWVAKKPKPVQNRYKQLYKEVLSNVDERYFVTASLDGEYEKPFVHVREYTADGRATRSGIFFNSLKQIQEVETVLERQRDLEEGEIAGPFEQGVFLWSMPSGVYVLGVQPPYEGKKMVTGLRLVSAECNSLLGHLKTIMKAASDADGAEGCGGSLAVV